MTIAKVTAIAPTGEAPYASTHGLLYSFKVSFSDGQTGTVNAKSESGPAYKVGDSVGYEITGNYKGVSKIRVDKKAAQEAAAAEQRPPANSEPVAGQRLPNGMEPMAPVFGATVGMAIKEALVLLTTDLGHDDIISSVITPHFWKAVHEVSSDIIRVSLLLEKGKLAPPVRDRTEGPRPPAPPRATAPAPAPRRGQPENERQAANLATDDMGYIPF